jgi:hypothetical protein
LFATPSSDECRGSGNVDVGDILSDFPDGIAYTCHVATGNGCGGQLHCVRIDRIDSRTEQAAVFFAMDERFDNGPSCDNSFAGAFGTGGAPPKFGGSVADEGRVYVQNGCFNSHRIVTLPIVDDGPGGGVGIGVPRSVEGFVTVYLTGCFEAGDSMDDPDVDSDCREAWIATAFGSSEYELRGVPLYTYVTRGATGGITSTDRSSVLTIQTVQ